MDVNLKIDYLPVDSLKPYDKNARRHTDIDVGKIVNSIREFSFSDPIGVWGKDNLIVEGHGRLLAAKKLGMKEVPCIHLDHLTDVQRRAYALAHNRTAELSAWIDDVLGSELDALADLDFDMSEFGFELTLDDELDVTEDFDDFDSDFDDVEKFEKHYGVPYQGNKSRIADIIINLLPEGERLVDLFGGGRCYNTLRNALR